MKSSVSIHIRKMVVPDLALGKSLVTEAGWNQTYSDWLRAMELDPDGCWVAEWEGVPVATTTTCTFGEVGWVAMVLVSENARGQGIASELLRHAIEYLEQKAVKTIRLDATPLGQELYKKLGFEDEYQLVRYSGTVPHTMFSASLEPISTDSSVINAISRLDEEITGGKRNSFLRALIRADSAPFFCTKDQDEVLTGYAGCRRGTNATQIGPAIAITPTEGILLMNNVASKFSGEKIFVDIPLQNTDAIKWANELGLTEQRRFTRMRKGAPVSDNPKLIWASSGPEKG